MNIYHFTDYREAIRAILDERRKLDSSWSYTRFSEALRVQKTYISKVFKGEANFNSDQLHLATRALDLTPEESDYLYLLLEYTRTSLPERRKQFQGRIRQIQSEQKSTRKHLRAKMVNSESSEKFTAYYLDPIAPLVHAYLSIPEYRKAPELIRAKLSLTAKQLKSVLELLENLGIVRWNAEKKHYDTLLDHLQLPSDSPICQPYQLMFRLQTLQQIKKLDPNERFLFSVTFSGNETTQAAIHEEFLKFLRRAEALVKDAPPEGVFQMNFDLFPWK